MPDVNKPSQNTPLSDVNGAPSEPSQPQQPSQPLQPVSRYSQTKQSSPVFEKREYQARQAPRPPKPRAFPPNPEEERVPPPPPPKPGFLNKTKEQLSQPSLSKAPEDKARIRIMEEERPPKPPLPAELKDIGKKEKTAEEIRVVYEEDVNKNWIKKVLTYGSVVVLAGGLGVFFYFIVLPLIFPPSPVPSETLEETVVSHMSYFAAPVESRARINFLDLTFSNIRDALSQTAKAALPSGKIKEVEILDTNDRQVPASRYLVQLAPSLNEQSLSEVINADFTSFLYYTEKGVWPGYVFKVKDPALARGMIGPALEEFAARFYISSPGAIGEFKNADYKGTGNRYALGTSEGASFNYGIAGDFLVVSTNFDGYKAALAALGF